MTAGTGPVAIGVIAPHGDEAIPEACDDATRDRAAATQHAMAEMARRVAAARPDVAVVATPHNVHVEGHMAVLTAAQVSGRLDESPNPVELTCPVDHGLAVAIHGEMNQLDVPTVAVSFGGNVASESSAPMDWGALIPLWHLTRTMPDLAAVVMAPARDLSTEAHVRAGAAVVRAARALGRRIVFVASADQGHGHAADGPYGFHEESAEFDGRVQDLVRRNALEELVGFGAAYAQKAMADSWWQMVMLQGALAEDGGSFRAELLAYEAPTYFGMLTAVFERRPE